MDKFRTLVTTITLNAFLFALLMPSLCHAHSLAMTVDLDGKGDDLTPLDGDEQDVPLAIAEFLDALEVVSDGHVRLGEAELRRLDDTRWVVWIPETREYEIIEGIDRSLVDTLVLAADLHRYDDLDAEGQADVMARLDEMARDYLEALVEGIEVVDETLILVGDGYLERLDDGRWIAVSDGVVMGVMEADGIDIAKQLLENLDKVEAVLADGTVLDNDDLLGSEILVEGPDGGLLEVPPFVGEIPMGGELILPDFAMGIIDMWMNAGADGMDGGAGTGAGDVLDGIAGVLGAIEGGLGALAAALVAAGATAAGAVLGIVGAIIALVVLIIEAIKKAKEKKDKEKEEDEEEGSGGGEEGGTIWHPTGEEGPGSLLIDALMPVGTLEMNIGYLGQYAP